MACGFPLLLLFQIAISYRLSTCARVSLGLPSVPPVRGNGDTFYRGTQMKCRLLAHADTLGLVAHHGALGEALARFFYQPSGHMVIAGTADGDSFMDGIVEWMQTREGFMLQRIGSALVMTQVRVHCKLPLAPDFYDTWIGPVRAAVTELFGVQPWYLHVYIMKKWQPLVGPRSQDWTTHGVIGIDFAPGKCLFALKHDRLAKLVQAKLAAQGIEVAAAAVERPRCGGVQLHTEYVASDGRPWPSNTLKQQIVHALSEYLRVTRGIDAERLAERMYVGDNSAIDSLWIYAEWAIFRSRD